MSGNMTPKDLEDAPDYGGQKFPNQGMGGLTSGDPNPEFMPDEARKLGREIFASSTNWLNSGRRAKWNDSLRAFQGLHPSGSKYLSNDYRYRSRLFRPKTRGMVRKAEAATAAAFFANEDIIRISAQDDDDKMQQASAEILQKLVQYRLTKTIPWFQTLVGARQDAEVMGVCIGKVFWKYSEQLVSTEDRPKLDQFGMPTLDEYGGLAVEQFDTFKKTSDHPWIDLIPPENFRFDAGADWRNPIATSPYTIEMVPMYVCDVQAKIDSKEWLYVSNSSLFGATDLDDDVTRRSREQGRVPGKDHDAWKPRPFDICWVRENIVRKNGKEWHFYSLSSGGELLTNPRPLEEVYLQGIRPYVCGNVVTEAHKTYPSSKVELIKDLQTQTNDVTNLRLDNVKLALNPRQFVMGGQGLDPQDLRTFMPGKVSITTGKAPPSEVVMWDRPPEVTSSSYQEQDRLNMDFDELVGGTSNSNIEANRSVYQAVGNMELMVGNSSQIEEYDQRVFTETFVEPVLRHFIKLEQAYETDSVVLAIAGREAQLFQKFGINEITDELLKQELSVKVNVGIGATNPQKRLQNFLTAAKATGEIFGPAAAMGANFEEFVKEVFGLCGYKDGARFFLPNFDVHKAQQDLAQGKQKPQIDPQAQFQSDMALQNAKNQGAMQIAQLNAEEGQKKAYFDFQLEERRIRMEIEQEDRRQQAQGAQETQQNEQELIVSRDKAILDYQLKRELEMTKIALKAHSENNSHALETMKANGIKPDDMLKPFMETISKILESQNRDKKIVLDNGREATVTTAG